MRSSDIRPPLTFGVRDRGFSYALKVMFIGAMEFGALVGVAISIARGSVIGAVGSVSAGVFVAMILLAGLGVRPSTAVGDDVRSAVVWSPKDGSTLRYQPRHRWVLIVLHASAVVVALSVASTGKIHFAAIALVAAAVSAWHLIDVVRGHVTAGYVRLTQYGIEHKGFTFSTVIAWDDVLRVMISHPEVPLLTVSTRSFERIQHHSFVRHSGFDHAPIGAIRIDCRMVDVHPNALLAWIDFYVRYPAARTEIGTEVATDRLAGFRPWSMVA